MRLIDSILGMLLKLSEGTSVYRVVEGFLVLLSLASILLISMVFNTLITLTAFGLISIYGSHHLRRCRNLYQGYLLGIEGAGYRLNDRSIYRGVIASIIAVEILMIVGGLFIAIAPLLSLDPWLAISPAVFIVISFGVVAIVGHFTRVKLYRIFVSKVLRSG